MKKLSSFIIILIISLPSFSQFNIGGQGTTNGVELSMGVTAQEVDVQLSYNMPLTSAVKPRITTLTMGKIIFVSDKPENYNYSITPSIGLAAIRTNIFNKTETDIIEIRDEFKPIYKIELGKDSYMGRFIITAAYSTKFIFGFGVRGFFR